MKKTDIDNGGSKVDADKCRRLIAVLADTTNYSHLTSDDIVNKALYHFGGSKADALIDAVITNIKNVY